MIAKSIELPVFQCYTPHCHRNFGRRQWISVTRKKKKELAAELFCDHTDEGYLFSRCISDYRRWYGRDNRRYLHDHKDEINRSGLWMSALHRKQRNTRKYASEKSKKADFASFADTPCGFGHPGKSGDQNRTCQQKRTDLWKSSGRGNRSQERSQEFFVPVSQRFFSVKLPEFPVIMSQISRRCWPCGIQMGSRWADFFSPAFWFLHSELRWM